MSCTRLVMAAGGVSSCVVWQTALLAMTAVLACCLADDVITLTADNFDETIAAHRVILVEFYAPWCEHCKRLVPQYEQAAATLAAEHLALAKVDATEDAELVSRFDVEGYPTLKVFRSGTPYEYEGPHTAAGIVEFMRAVAQPDWQPPRDPVLVLTQRNFSRTVSSPEPTLVEFYAPWCGHCKRLAPEYKRAATELARMGVPASLAKVDATVETQLATQYEVKGYPTLKLFRNGEDKEYTGTRDIRGIVQYMMQQARPASREVASRRELSTLRKDILDPLIVTFASNEEDPVLRAHLAAADEGRGQPVLFAHCLSVEVAASYGLGGGDTAIFTPKWFRSQLDPEMKAYRIDVEAGEVEGEGEEEGEGEGEGEGRMSKVLEGLLAVSRPLVGVRVKKNEEWFSSRPLLVLYCDMEELEYVRGLVAGLARDYSGRLTVALSSNDEYEKELEVLGLGESGEDVNVGMWGEEGRERYAMTKPTSQDNIRQFIEAYFAGELQPVMRSQPRPKKARDGAVTVVVGSTFQEVILDPARDVLVEFYAPWCGHCKALEPVYQKLAKKYKKNESLVVAKFDATANDAPPQFQFSGFPALFFVPAGPASLPVLYTEQERELEDLEAFIEAHRTRAGSSSSSSSSSREEL